MEINKLASQGLKFMVEFRSTVTVPVMCRQLQIDSREAVAVMMYILRRRKSWFSVVSDGNDGPAYIVSPKHIADVVKFLDRGGFR